VHVVLLVNYYKLITMTITIKKVHKDVLNVVKLAKEWGNKNSKTLQRINIDYGKNIIDNPPSDLPLMEDVVRNFLYEENTNYSAYQNVLCLASIKDLFSDPTYNRTNEIDYNKCVKNIKFVEGYSNDAADILSAYLRSSGKDAGKVVLTKGNHRTTMRYFCGLDPEQIVPIALKLHSPVLSQDEMVEIEAKDHTRDCAYRATQQGDSKFKSAYHANEGWAETLHIFAAQFGIGIAGTLPDAKYEMLSHTYLSRARKTFGADTVGRFLKAFTQNSGETKIYGNTVVSGSSFIHFYKTIIDQVDQKYNVDSFADMIKFFFNEYPVLMKQIGEPFGGITQDKITECRAVNASPGNELGVARFVFLYNQYCLRQPYTLKESANTVIPFNGGDDSPWGQFLNTCSTLIRPAIQGIATTKFY